MFSGNVTVPENRTKKNSKAYKKNNHCPVTKFIWNPLKKITYATNRKIWSIIIRRTINGKRPRKGRDNEAFRKRYCIVVIKYPVSII